MAKISEQINEWVAQRVEALERERALFNYHSVAALVPVDAQVIDIGAWTGYVGELLAEHRGADVTNVDVVDGHKTTLPFFQFDGRHLPLEDASADVVLLLYVLHHAADARTLLGEARRVCRPGGRIIIAEDSIDGLWNRCLTLGLHVWLKCVAQMGWQGKFRTAGQWRAFFENARLTLLETRMLGHHLGRLYWPQNLLFILQTPAKLAPGVPSIEALSRVRPFTVV